ncbi:MAG: agmatinase [Thermosphaera sp.]|nr:agmatinase [Thermosphaera sp.]
MAWKTMLTTQVFGCVENPSSPFAIIGVPLDHTSTYRPGTRFAPQRIREAACNIELYSLTANIVLEEVGFKDYGDLLLQPNNVENTLGRIELASKNLLGEHRELVIVLGGEHLITYPGVRASISEIDTLIVFDAHLDMRDEYMGSRLNHATFLRRVLEEQDINVVHIGSRAYSKGELEYAERSGVKVYNILDVYKGGVTIEQANRVYVSVDVDVFDPSIAPGVGNPEPPGITLTQFLDLLGRIFESAESVRMVDIVEVNPLVDHGDVTSVLAAKIGVEASGLYYAKRIQ